MEFSDTVEQGLQQIAERLMPHEDAILASWIEHQWDAWQPPELTQEELQDAFRGILHIILHGMHGRRPEQCIGDLAALSAKLADRAFPFEALIISIHFLEQSYLPYLLDEPPKHLLDWLISMDEFMHSVLSSIAGAYFEVHRRDLLDRAEVGQLVQKSLLVDIPKAVLDLEVGYIYASARERAHLGGDFLDSFKAVTGEPVFIVGDLSGHGLAAVADSVMVRSLFRGFVIENPDIAEAMTRLNRVLVFQLPPDHFATALALMYVAPGRLKLVSAGHPPPVRCGNACALIEPRHIALGVVRDSVYSVDSTELDAGDVLVAYTDGLIEARHGKELFGMERLMSEICAVRDAPARAIAEHLRDESLRFAGGTLTDDVAVLVLKRNR